MKYENFKQVKSLCEQIDKHKEKLAELSSDNCTVVIKESCTGTIYTIGTWQSCEHEYKNQASDLIYFIKDDLSRRIENIKAQLELL